MDKSELPYLIALTYIQGIGPIRIKLLIDGFIKPSVIWKAKNREIKEVLGAKLGEIFILQRSKISPQILLEEIERLDIKLTTLWDKDYPKLLKEIPDSPPILYHRGELLPQDNKALAIVGTRKISTYGKQVTGYFSRELSRNGFTIVSGLARGVDSLSHRSALEAGGRTIAVLGSGLNQIYPPENESLAEEISDHGAVISEFPPDFPPSPGAFPARNRIISGLSLGVIVTEAAHDSGSLITANCALEQNREVFAVPGPIFSKMSEGTSKLIKEGAKLINSVGDVLEELGFERQGKVEPAYETKNQLEADLLALLEEGQKHIDELTRLLKVDPSTLGSCLSFLELHDVVKNLGSGIYVKKR